MFVIKTSKATYVCKKISVPFCKVSCYFSKRAFILLLKFIGRVFISVKTAEQCSNILLLLMYNLSLNIFIINT